MVECDGGTGVRTIASFTKSLSLIVTVKSAFCLPFVRLGVPLFYGNRGVWRACGVSVVFK